MAHNYVNEFQDSMNRHPHATYKAVTGPGGYGSQSYVLELERFHSGSDRGRLVAWRRPTASPRHANWGKVGVFYGEYEKAHYLFTHTEDTDDVDEFCDEHPPDEVWRG